MKRSHEGSDDESPSSKLKVDSVKDSDVSLLKEMKDKLENEGHYVTDQMNRVKREYYMSYIKNVMNQLPLSQNIMGSLKEEPEGSEGFLRMFSVAKTVVHSEIQLKKLRAFNAIYDMVNGLIGKVIHDRYISPYLSHYLSQKQLNRAFKVYQETLASDDESRSLELQCIAYLIQTELEKDEPLKIPNPLFNRFTQQMKAISQYVTVLLSTFSGTAFETQNREGYPAREKEYPEGDVSTFQVFGRNNYPEREKEHLERDSK
ncbi:hypothetical protein AVEN_250088-1 [Araneus ventricosus]|uniref:Uncharacterized protein n=1 Tax=Araneus ventricosus TaxID=182803 RepID=A0A4Y2VHZ7_ARAVE|nr:hypothetical protein AVEN_250088-1 [Araneus ventricosus]